MALLAVFTLGACGGDDGGSGGAPNVSGDEKAAADEIAASFKSDDSGLGGEVSDADAACVGAKLVKALGVKRVQELGFDENTDVVLTKAEAEKAADAVVSCVDLRKALVSSFTEGGDISDKSAKCLAGKLTDDDIKGVLVASFQGNEEDMSGEFLAKMMTGMAACLTPDEMKKVTQ
jgi:hypothetical protein